MKFCVHPGCTTRFDGPGSRCPEHGRQHERVTRGTATERLYDWRWRKAAKSFLQRFPLCGQRPRGVAPVMSRCYLEARVTAAVQVDHVEPHRGDLRKFWDEENWQALCRTCGARKSQAGL